MTGSVSTWLAWISLALFSRLIAAIPIDPKSILDLLKKDGTCVSPKVQDTCLFMLISLVYCLGICLARKGLYCSRSQLLVFTNNVLVYARAELKAELHSSSNLDRGCLNCGFDSQCGLPSIYARLQIRCKRRRVGFTHES